MKHFLLVFICIVFTCELTFGQVEVLQKKLDLGPDNYSIVAGAKSGNEYWVLGSRPVKYKNWVQYHSNNKFKLFKYDLYFNKTGEIEIDYDFLTVKTAAYYLGYKNGGFYLMLETKIKKTQYEQSLFKINLNGEVSSHFIRMDKLTNSEVESPNFGPSYNALHYAFTPDSSKIGLLFQRRGIGIHTYIYDLEEDKITSQKAVEFPESFDYPSKLMRYYRYYIFQKVLVSNDSEFYLIGNYVSKKSRSVRMAKIDQNGVLGYDLSNEGESAYKVTGFFKNDSLFFVYLMGKTINDQYQTFAVLLDQNLNMVSQHPLKSNSIRNLYFSEPTKFGNDIIINYAAYIFGQSSKISSEIVTLKIDENNNISSVVTERMLGIGPDANNLLCIQLNSNTLLFSNNPKQGSIVAGGSKKNKFFLHKMNESEEEYTMLDTGDERVFPIYYGLFDDKSIVIGSVWDEPTKNVYRIQGL